jgi:hypothetical protein
MAPSKRPGTSRLALLLFSLAVGDFNGDGLPDLAVANQNSSNVSVLLGMGDGSFQAAVSFAAGRFPSSLAVCDFNGDGVLDLAVTNGPSPPGSDDVGGAGPVAAVVRAR